MTRFRLSALLGATALGALGAASPATAQQARTRVTPYIELSQTVDADLKGGDVLTYTSLAAGVDATIDTSRASGQASYRYEHRFAWNHDLGDSDVHSGLARGIVRVAPGLSVEGGGIATRVRSDIRGDAPGILTGNSRNVSQVYSLYAGPTLAREVGDVSVSAAYRIGYTKVTSPSFSPLIAGQPRLDYYDSSVGQAASASAAIRPGVVLPVGLTGSAGWEQERAGQLHQHFDDAYVRGDVLVPVSPYVALTGGVGYEKLTTSERSPVFTAGGVPAVDERGRFITDTSSPRRITYRTDGLYYDAGVVWRPNRRTAVEGHVGRRYGSTSYTGLVTYQASHSVGVAAQVYDQVTTFGRQLRTGLANLPTSFVSTRDQFAQAYNGCIFGTTGATPGGCLNDVFQSVTTASYRARGIDAVLTATRGPSTYGVGAGYANRKLYAPDLPNGVTIYGLEDESYYAQIFYGRSLTAVSGFNTQAFLNLYDPGLVSAHDVLSVGATASYYHDFGRLGTTAAVGVYAFRVGDGLETSLRGQALLGARYSF